MGLDAGALTTPPKASLIISVYKNAKNLECILEALSYQTYKTFEVLVSEDGCAPEISQVIKTLQPKLTFGLQHLTQPDIGFRKNKSLNAAIKQAKAEILIFIDGDCVPHSKFIESHVNEASAQSISTGRRVELGPRISRKLIEVPARVRHLSNTFYYSLSLPLLALDGVKNPESGYFSSALHRLAKHRPLGIVGCNFSCSKQALNDINGFNEEYEAPGIGEDSDIEWRLIRAGYAIKNIKFLAPVFHLWHPRSYSLSLRNQEIYAQTRAKDQWSARRGLYSFDVECTNENRTVR
jgi:cellulose synthase/poly-beta-1,6-N-acetylglucosamine synthase-like glycosyltransferase